MTAPLRQTARLTTGESGAEVEFEVRGRVAVITINRPQARNAINAAVAKGLEAAVDRLEADDGVWVGVLTATPPVFCAGADLKEIGAGRRDQLRTARGGFAGFVARDRTKPVIAAVDGPAMAGGAEICLACDLVVASTAATFSIPEVKRGLVAAAGGLFRLPSRLPLNIAMEMVLTGEPVDADRAHHLGLVNRVTEPGTALDAAMLLAEEIAANAPSAVRASRRVMRAALGLDSPSGWRLSEEAMSAALSSAEMREGVAAFVEKRPPQWSTQ
ncbi:crotonase/enoyl-CoA hydratase family protein [Phycicoccus sp. Soil802]|uniref:crotonase/enoyl-CoA hydratase family protein n=1 Tax=Phycicoccus sp. Soil802 TaxID=1736414 RepID=UPI0007033706|nr:crotonase/enoyl-CoA hydratase family protein [Phycicoccus sp. Soil802]KRF22388.1 enoyl-CoA hydratase [Phycicoccus sp. Soil802]